VTVIEYVQVAMTPPSGAPIVSDSVPWAPVDVTMIVTDEVDVAPCAVSVQFSMYVPLLQLCVQPAGTPPSPAPASDG
jgi:hypothetical protein